MLIIFKLILLAGLAYLIHLVISRTKFRLFHRIFSVALGIVLGILVIYPELATRIASFFGIGRGVDFIFYLSHFFIFYLLLRLYMLQQETRRDIEVLVRTLALEKAKDQISLKEGKKD